jgi:hypothetical protein
MECSHQASSTVHHRDAAGASGILGVNIAAFDHLVGRCAAQSNGLASVTGMQRDIGIRYDEVENCHSDAPLLNTTTGMEAHGVCIFDHRWLPFDDPVYGIFGCSLFPFWVSEHTISGNIYTSDLGITF